MYRDIKTENFMLKSKSDSDNIKLIDFGLSKDYSGQAVMSTPSGSVCNAIKIYHKDINTFPFI